MKKTLHFRTSTLLKNLVGKDLINDDNIAIVELVKNSYDAESREVLVRFTNFSPKGFSTETSQLIIFDEGSGMDFEDIRDKWLNIAYSEKKLQKQKAGAFLAGNKGIGRFSCDRLGAQLDLITRKENSDIFFMQIKWPDFEIEGNIDLTIQDIDLDIQTIDEEKAAFLAGIQNFPKQGTALIISNLRSYWDRDKLKELKISLEKFLNPNQLFLRNQFGIKLSVPMFEKLEENYSYSERINGYIQNQIFEKLRFNSTYIEAEISGKEESRVSIVLFHDGEKVFELVERNEAYPLLRNAHIVIYYLNPYKKAYFKRQTGVRSVDFGSIFLFLNGFRIAPYGDRSNDWLSLDVRKTQGTARYLGSRDIVGRIEIQGSDEQFMPVSSREGLKNTPSFQQLREGFFRDTLLKLEKFVVDGLQWDSVPSQLRQELITSEGLDWENTSEKYSESWDRKKQRIILSMMTLIGSNPDRIIRFWFNPTLLEDVYESRQDEVKNLLVEIGGLEPRTIDAGLSNSLSKIRKFIEEKEVEVNTAKSIAADLRVEVAQKDMRLIKVEAEAETYHAQTLFLQQVSSFDVKQLMSYHHQINLDTIIVDNYISRVIKALRNIPSNQEVLDYLQKASMANKRIASVAQFASKANFRSGIKKEITDIPSFFEQYLLYVAPDYIATGLELDINNLVHEPFEVKASRIELSILIDNIISNANKAQAHKLIITISKVSQNSLQVSFIDDGKGLSKDLPNVNSMFDLGITTTAGSGLGLYHAQNIVRNIDGKITAIPKEPNGMEIRVELMK